MKYIKEYNLFNEAYVNKWGKLVNMDWRNENDYNEFIKKVLEFIDDEIYINEDNYINLPLNFQILYKKICIVKECIFYNEIFIIKDILINYPEKSKKCLELNILKNITLNKFELPYYSEVIEILPLDYQKYIISTILKYSKKYYITDNQYEAFDMNVQKIITFNKEKIIVY